MSDLRPYQQEAIDATYAAFASNRSALIVLPTGTGKTVVFAKIAQGMRNNGRALVLAHREELLTQAREKIEAWTGMSTGLEKAQASCAGTLLPPDVVVGSVQTLQSERRRALYARDAFGLVIVDEAHHSTSPTYVEIIEYFSSAKVLGVTATPDRLDKKGLGAVFNVPAYVYEIRDAIEQGYLAPIRQKAVQVEGLDLSKVRTTAGDLNEGDLEKILLEEKELHGIAEPTVKLSEGRKTLVFGTSVAHAHALAEVINRYAGAGAARAMDGSADSELRRDTISDFKAGRFQFLVNCMLYTEGFDLPAIACVAVGRPTKSRALYAQMVGRGTRTYCPLGCSSYCQHAEAKRDLLILDFVGNAGKHALVCALDVLDGNMDLDVRAAAAEAQAKDPTLTVLDALDLAEKEIAEAKRKAVTAQARTRVVDVDPFTVLGVHPRSGRWAGASMTDKQAETLERAGLKKDLIAGFDKGQASEVLSAIFERRDRGLCSFKQAKLLMKYGLNPDVPFDVAKSQIDAIAGNGWRVPGWLADQNR